MFCPECGTKNEDGALFCAECGTKLVDNVVNEIPQTVNTNGPVMNQQPYYNQQAVAKAPRKPLSKAAKIVIGEAVVFCIAAVAFYKIGTTHYNASQVAKNHAIHQMNGDWDEVYDDFDIKEDDFINRSAFIKANETKELSQYSNLKVAGGTSSKEDDEIVSYVTVKYALSGEDEESQETLSLIKQSGKKILFFDNWEVSPSSYICKDFTLYLPKGAEASLNGEKIDSSYLSSDDSDSYTDCYIIPRIFYGSYEITVTKENMEDVTETVDTNDGYYQLSSMQLNSDILQNAITKAGEDWNSILTAAVQQKKYDEISALFTGEDVFKDNYEDVLANFEDDEVKAVNIGSMQPYVSYDDGDDGLTVRVELDFDYDITFMQTDWWDGTKSEDTYNSSSSVSFEYLVTDSEMKIDYISFYLYYY